MDLFSFLRDSGMRHAADQSPARIYPPHMLHEFRELNPVVKSGSVGLIVDAARKALPAAAPSFTR